MEMLSQPFTVRSAVVEDIPQIWQAHMASIRHSCSDSYPEETISAWSGCSLEDTLSRYKEAILHHCVWVAELGGKIEGFCHLQLNGAEAELKSLYLAPLLQGRKAGRILFELAEATAHEGGAETFFLKATLNAVPFYEKMGMNKLAPEIIILATGEPVDCVKMAKSC